MKPATDAENLEVTIPMRAESNVGECTYNIPVHNCLQPVDIHILQKTIDVRHWMLPNQILHNVLQRIANRFQLLTRKTL